MAKPNQWVDFIRKWAKDNNTTYSCALSEGKCKEAYRAKYGIRKPVPAKTERERMGLEDVNVGKKKAKSVGSVEQKKYDIVKKILMELDRLEGNYGDDRDPFGDVKDLMIIPEREGKTKKQIVDRAFNYFQTHTNVYADIRRSVLMRKLFAELTELIETENMGLEDVNIKPKPKRFKEKVEEYLAELKKKAKPVEKKKKLKIREDNEPIRVKKITIDGVVYLVDKATGTRFFDLDTQDEIEDPRKGKSGGKKGAKAAWRSTKKGIDKGLSKTASVLNMTNPVIQMNSNTPVGDVMGNLSYNYALPAMVSMGYYAYIAAAEGAATMMGLPPQVGKEAAEILWYEMVERPGYDPRERQKNKALGIAAASTGRLAFGGGLFYRL